MKGSKAYCIVQSTKVMRIVLCKAQRRSVECSSCESIQKKPTLLSHLYSSSSVSEVVKKNRTSRKKKVLCCE